MLAEALRFLACPHCGETLRLDGRAVRCASGHAFDVARQGYVSLLPGDASPHRGDTPGMVQARAAFLDAGHYRPGVDAVAGIAAEAAKPAPEPVCVADVGAGTGHWLAAVLERLPEASGVALDASKPALRRAARAHPRMAAVACDAWGSLPLAAGAAAVVLNVLAPRNAAELHRVLRPDGALVVVSPSQRHLGQLVQSLGLLRVDPRKEERLDRRLGGWFTQTGERAVEWTMTLARRDIERLVAMGPSAWHTDDPQRADRVAALPEPLEVTASITAATYQPAPSSSSGDR